MFFSKCLRFFGFLVVPAFAGLIAASFPAKAQDLFRGDMKTVLGKPDSPLQVGIGIKIDQITSVDQKSENYGAVVVIRAEWKDPALAFDPEVVGRDIRVVAPRSLADHAESIGTVLPAFVIHNQQSNRWIHESAAAVSSDGSVIYVEKSNLTLQAPHFNFLKYPFDTQEFHFEVVSILPSEFVSYEPLHQFSGLGDQLGEEEWILGNARLEKSHVIGLSGRVSDQVALVFDGNRHLTYYVIRVFLPMLVLVTVSWTLFFLDEYRKRIEISGANLLVFVAFNWAISADLPKLGYLTFLDFILQWMFVVTGAIIVFNVVLRKIKVSGRDALARKLDNYAIKWIYPLGYAAIVGYAVFAYLLVPS
ncbi:hypothetical protein FGK63_12170 [Ruegeria sediminis]|uniref:Neurotransmitter-gated ion-channel ligand-binding domain-containing protein n=1 Tax=Ruegeria sediminis TaxID=2583820 RepID=A0ABY2WWS4_9RHOB|nr:hypothetical protein [Ruegeria sediminis]TMV06871.1 hypothetical protein FGK63_12170 [Ruegeria sediminis]